MAGWCIGAHAICPEMHDPGPFASLVFAVVFHFCQLFSEGFRSCRRRCRWADRSDQGGGVEEEGFHLTEERQHGRAFWGFLTDPGDLVEGDAVVFKHLPQVDPIDDGHRCAGIVRSGPLDVGLCDAGTQCLSSIEIGRRFDARHQPGPAMAGHASVNLCDLSRKQQFEHGCTHAIGHSICRWVGFQTRIGQQTLDAVVELESQWPIDAILPVRRYHQRIELSGAHIGVGSGGIGRIGERKIGIGQRIRCTRDRIAAISVVDGREVVFGDELTQDLVPAQDGPGAPVIHILLVIPTDIFLQCHDLVQLRLEGRILHRRRIGGREI